MRFILAFAVLLASTAWAHEKSPPTAAAAQRMRDSASLLMAVVPKATLLKILRPFDDRDRTDWHYTPRSRNGAALKELNGAGREAVHALLKQALSASGYAKVVNIIELEIVLREIETFGLMRDPERYHLTIYGAPNAKDPWGWRFEGHHLSLNFTLIGERVAVDAPSFFGANPARVAKGPRQGLRALGAEEDAARTLLAALDDAQRAEAVFEARTYGDIVTGNAEKVDPLKPVGIAAARLHQIQREHLLALIEVYARSFEPSLARARMARVRAGGIENIRFGWAGSTERGRPHYYRVQGPQFLIEYDASQNDGNHVHTVWRDFNGDFGRDLLKLHYEAARGTSHKH
jgi:hypothetical protein